MVGVGQPSVRSQMLLPFADRDPLDNLRLLVFEVDIAPRAVMVQGNGFPYRVQDRRRPRVDNAPRLCCPG